MSIERDDEKDEIFENLHERDNHDCPEADKRPIDLKLKGGKKRTSTCSLLNNRLCFCPGGACTTGVGSRPIDTNKCVFLGGEPPPREEELILVPRKLLDQAQCSLHRAYEGGEWCAALPDIVPFAAAQEQEEGLEVRDEIRRLLKTE